MIKVSIVIPVFNTEKFIGRCLDSVINQSLSDIQIICINDGSTDNCEKILKQYSLLDSRIEVVTQVHKGQSNARNVGVNKACGKYLNFRRDLLHEPNVALFDAVAMAAALWDDFILETQTCHASCITAEGETHGQVIFYRKNITYDTMITFDSYNVEVVTKIKAADFVPRYRASI